MVAPTSNLQKVSEGRVLLRDVPWETYERLARDLEGQRIYLTYDRGDLEIMSPSPQHERIGKFLSRMVEAYTLELRIPIVGLGNATWKKPQQLRGLEADECYYIANAEIVKSKEDFDLTIDPPPDLAIEVDVTSASIEKQSIYATIGVPELWRYENESLVYLRLTNRGTYEAIEKSVHLPNLARQVVQDFCRRRTTADDTTLLAEFVDWVRANSGR